MSDTRSADASRMPRWTLPVVVGLPLWAFFYAFAFSPPRPHQPSDPLVVGQQLYLSKGCSGCHGLHGEGGLGPRLAGGQAALTFPDIAAQVAWIQTGSGPYAGQRYGDPNRPGGQHGPAKGLMQGFKDTMTPQEIEAVARYERERL